MTIYTSTVFDYGSKGDPLAMLHKKVTIIQGFESAYKHTIGADIKFALENPLSAEKFYKGTVFDDKPSDILGTICMFKKVDGGPMMSRKGKPIFVKGNTAPLKKGEIIEYRTIVRADNCEVAWVVEGNRPIDLTIDNIVNRSSIIGFEHPDEKMMFSEILTKIRSGYKTDTDIALESIDQVYNAAIKRLEGETDIEGKHDLLYRLTFIKIMLGEHRFKAA